MPSNRIEWSEYIAEGLDDYTQALKEATPEQLYEARVVISQVAEASASFLAFYNSLNKENPLN